MIDFSQVVMLTFVNAFKETAGGNFLNALKLTQITSLDPDQYGTGKTGDMAALIGASILGLLMLGATLTLLLIMTMFLVVRIVGLWMILIFSPIAFFALALPGKLQSGFSAFTSDWWSKLSTFLIAGPVMAFFLWLTLAVVQGSQEPFGSVIGGARDTEEVNNVTKDANFITKVGKASNIATYLVAFIMMLEGVNFAVRQAGAASSRLGGFATLAAAGGGAAVHLARGAARVGGGVARVGGRAAGKVGGAAFEGVDYLADVRGKVGRAGLAASARLGGVGAETAARLATHRPRVVKEKRTRLAKITEGLAAPQKLAFAQQRAKALNRNEAAAAQMEVAQISASRGGMDVLKKQGEMEALRLRPELAGDENANERSIFAEALANQSSAKAIKSGRDAAEAVGDDTVVEKLDDIVQKNTSLQVDWGKLGGVQATEDYKGYSKGLKSDAFKDSGAFLAHGRALGFVNEDGRIDKQHEAYQYLEKTGGDRWAFVKEHTSTFDQAPEKVQSQLSAMRRGATDDEKRIADEVRSFVSKGAQGAVQSVNVSGAVNPMAPVPHEVAARRQRVQTNAEQLRQLGAPTQPNALNLQRQLLIDGAPLAAASGFNPQAGEFRTSDHRDAFEEVTTGVDTALRSDQADQIQDALRVLNGVDLEALQSNPDELNEARSTFLGTLTPEALRRGYEAAALANQEGTKRKITNILDLYRREGQRADRIAKQVKVNKEDLRALAENPAGDHDAVLTKLREKTGTDARAVELARIVRSSDEINASEQFRGIRQELDPRAARAVRNTGRNNNA